MRVLLCPTCFAGIENGTEYFITFVLLTVLPLATMGTILWWLVRRIRRADAVDAAERGDQSAARSSSSAARP